MNGSALVSVIIPVYNGELYLEEAIASVLTQRHRPLEVLVIDDGSTDRTAEVARGFGAAVQYIYRPHSGLSSTLNNGVELARGNFFAFLDADDLWTPEKLEPQMAVLNAQPEIEAVFGGMQFFFSPDLDEKNRRRLHCPEGVITAQLKATMLIRRASFFRVGLFDISLKMGDFVDWYAKAQEKGLRSLMLPQLVLRRRIHANNTTLREHDDKTEYLRIVREALRRRRQQAAHAVETEPVTHSSPQK